MHELSVCQALLAQVAAVARAHDAQGVRAVRLRVGPLSGVEVSLLKQAYPVASAGTLAESSELLIELAPIRVKCETCGAESEAQPNRLLCARCGDDHTRLMSGDELMLMSVELVI
ncbi:hydrogenase maturation nickel metallochaperone HypA [Thiobacter aerophilum]|uniref:Hydrogenase maturation factor HypA n=1 Tax=Thiobacter aerophilum TaxID=3121275 RepID=A0ABV0EKV0_9BURK